MTLPRIHTHYRGAPTEVLAKRWLSLQVEYVLVFLATMCSFFLVWMVVKSTTLGEKLGWGDAAIADKQERKSLQK